MKVVIIGLCALTASFVYAQSDPVWVFRYAGTGNGDDEPLASFVDDTGNVYVVGWTEQATTHQDILLLKIDSLGRQVWVRTYDNGANREDVPAEAVRDTSGNIYISAGVANLSRGLVGLLKYDPSGNLVWMRSYGEANLNYAACGVALDDSQNVYVCAATDSSDEPIVRVLKYRPNGDLVWVKSYTAHGYSIICEARFHPLADGGVYLALSAEHPYRRNDWLIVKLSARGQVQWEKIYKETGNKWEQLKWSQVDKQGNIYLTGWVISATTGNEDFCTMKIDPSGNVLWTREYNAPDNSDRDAAYYLLLDRGYVYVAGRSVFVLEVEGETPKIVLVKYDSLGNQLWFRKYPGADTTCDLGYYDIFDLPSFCSMNVDESGNVYLAGSAYYHDAPSWYAVILKYDSLGNQIWVKKYFDPDRSYHGAIIGLDNRGAMYAIGTAAQAGQYDLYVMKYRGR